MGKEEKRYSFPPQTVDKVKFVNGLFFFENM